MRKIGLLLILALLSSLFFGCRKDNAGHPSIGILDNYAIERLKTLTLECGVEAPGYQWIVLERRVNGQVQKVGDTLSVDRKCVATFSEVGIYRMKFVLDDPNNHVEKCFNIWVDKESSEYSPLALEVLSYRPAPGPYVNYWPLVPTGKDPVAAKYEAMRKACVLALSKEVGAPISLGGFGGSLVVAFDHLVVNRPDSYDFHIERDREHIEGVTDMAVWVAFDRNRNGAPDDDEWYLLQSDREMLDANFTVSYSAGTNEPGGADDNVRGFNAPHHVFWKSKDSSGYIPRLKLNSAINTSYRPDKWLQDWEAPYTGVRYKNRAVVTEEKSVDGSDKLVRAFSELEYLPYNKPPQGAAPLRGRYDIDWAVDADGHPVQLPGIHFVRIVNATHEQVPQYGALGVTIQYVRDISL